MPKPNFFFVQCAWNSLVWMLCAESMELLLGWTGLHGIRCKVISTWHFEFNFSASMSMRTQTTAMTQE